MRIKFIFYFYCLVISLFNISDARTIDQSVDVNPIIFTSPANSVPDFALLTNGWDYTSSQSQMCNTDSSVTKYSESIILSSSSFTNYTITIDNVSYDIFETNISGIGWIMGVKDRNSSIWSPVKFNSPMTVYPFQPPYEGEPGFQGSSSLGAEIRFSYVKIPGEIPAGTYIIPGKQLASFTCKYKDSSNFETANIISSSTKLTLLPLTCNVLNSNKISIPLGEFNLNSLPGLNKNFGNFDTSINLSCDKGIKVAMTISDSSNNGNVSNIVSLSPDSSAKGIGVQVFYNNESNPKLLGPPSSSKGNINQFFVNNESITISNNQQVVVPLKFQYIQLRDNVLPGTANAVVSVTFSYQ